MSHGKASPRQKMINMMYLVLTALLALNVSAEILNAFILIDDSLIKTTENIELKNKAVYDKFEVFMQEEASKAKAKEWKEKADEVKALSEEVIKYIKEKQLEIVKTAEETSDKYEKEGLKGVGKKDDNNTPAEIMILKEGGIEFKNKLNKYRDDLAAIIKTSTKGKKAETVQTGDGIIKTLESVFDTKDIEGIEGSISWESANFEHMPLAAVITMFDKFATDVRNAESDVINFCIKQVDAGTWKFNKLEAIVNSPANYIMQGGEYKAEVFMAASDSNQAPNILVGNRRLKVENGKGVYTGATNTPGEKSWGGVIKLQSPVTGDTVEYEFKSKYEVFKPAISISPTKMNVFYIGVDNPVDVTASGVPAENLRVSISGGSIVRSGTGYKVRVKRSRDVRISVSTADGKSLGRRNFRCKVVPDPVATIGSDSKNKKGGIMPRSTLLALSRIKATMENFDFKLDFRITGFKIIATDKDGFDVPAVIKGSRINEKAKNVIRAAKKNSRVIFEEIRAKGPDGRSRKLNDLVIKLRG